ncbi:MAG: hypothetical protein GY913_13085 [Proteobacteria bacterium]|nr:hypothetical protein [Pseudomonadota bacterium]MCP4917842.1 hypothetical protein [Pseudomonadota bacterium]
MELDERVRGTAREDVLVRYAAIHREGFRELLMDPDREELLDALGAVSEDPGRWSLRRYLDEVFWPERKGTVAESTQKKEKLVWNQLLESPLAPRRIKSLDALSFERYLDSLRRRRLSGRTQALHRATYKALLDFAFRRGHVEKAWNTITPELCVGWVRHCGYAAQST